MTRRWLLVALIAVLSIGAIALTLLALDHVRTRPVTADVAPVPTFSQPSAQQTPSPTPSETSAAPASYDRSQERFLTVSAGVLWRGTAGQCGDVEPLLERSADDGQTWTDVTPRYLEIGQLVALNPFADGQAEIIAAMGEDCEVQALRTFTEGEFWEPYEDVLMNSQYVDPANPDNIVGPSETSASPCADTRTLHVSRSVIAVSCDGTAYTLAEDSSWAPLPLEHVTSLTVVDDELTVVHSADGCVGLALTRFAGMDEASAENLGCLTGADETAPTAIAISGNEALVWAGDDWIVTSS